MTILMSPHCFDGYQPVALHPDLFSLLVASVPKRHAGSTRVALLRLECFLQITDQSLRIKDLESQRTSQLLELFMGACYAEALGTGSVPARTCYFVKLALKHAFPALILPAHTTKRYVANEHLSALRAEFLKLKLNSERVEFWKGWHGVNAAGKEANLTLWHFYEVFGAEATRELSDAALTWWRGKRNHSIPLIQDLADFACRSGRAVDFKDPISLGTFLRELFHSWLASRAAGEKDIRSSVVMWGRFAGLLDNHLFGKAWAVPMPEIPRPRSRSARGTSLRVAMTEEGLEVMESLLAPIPLEISDQQAFQLLFKDIKSTHDIVVRWAEAEVELANARLAARAALAQRGVPYRHRVLIPSAEERLLRKSGAYLQHACATFEAEGLTHVGQPTATAVRYPKPYAETAWELGLPTPTILLAYGTILVDEHPALTSSLLADFELYDVKGRKYGIQKIDNAWIMTGFKRRRGSRLAEQKIELSARALSAIESIEKLTAPLRAWLKCNQRDEWRLLFLSIASIGRTPSKWSPNNEAHRQVAWLSSRMTDLLGIEHERALSIAKRFSLRRVRATRGVLIYIETCSLEAMARALGHHHFRQDLLDHYLPKPIQDFFTERWIRLFQTGIVCEALKDSRHLLDAAGFISMEDLDNFLEHHMLRKIPPHMEKPCRGEVEHAPSQFVFGLNIQNLTLLRSIELAVAAAPEEACGLATRWARISERLFPHLETQAEQPDLRAMATDALNAAEAASVRELIYA